MVSRRRLLKAFVIPKLAAVPAANVTADDWVDAQAFRGRVDPGTPGTDRQVIRVSGGVPRWRTEPMFHASDFSSLHHMVTVAQDAVTASVGGALMDLGEGEHVITEPLTFHRFAGGFVGAGLGPSPSFSPDPGRGSVIRWDGPAGKPMLLVTDSRHAIFENFRLEGKLAAGDVGAVQPTYGIEFRNPGGATYGTNRYITVRNVSIGRYPWSSQGTNKGDVARGIGLTGIDGNNDQMVIDHVWVMYPTEYGLYAPNSQSVGTTVRNLSVFAPGIAGVSVGTSMQFIMLKVFPYPLAIELTGTNITVEVEGYVFEGGDKLAKLSPNGSLILKGSGYVQCDQTIANANADPTNPTKGVLVQASPMHQGTFRWIDGRLTGNTNPARARIEIGGASPSHVGNFDILIENGIGMHPDQLRFAPGAGMWASSPVSRGTVEWTSTFGTGGTERYRFRNELRHSPHPMIGSGARTTLNKTVWDPVIIDHVTTVTANHTTTSEQYIIAGIARSGAITVALPTAVGITGKTYIVKKTDSSANTVMVERNGAETIGGVATKSITSQEGFIEVCSDGANWVIVSQGGTIT